MTRWTLHIATVSKILVILYSQMNSQLVSLVRAVRQLPNITIRGETAVHWPDLPGLAEMWGECVFNREYPVEPQRFPDQVPCIRREGDHNCRSGNEHAYSGETIAVTAFTAQLCAAHLVEANDFLSWAELDFYTALEKVPAEGPALKSADIQLLNVNVPIAAQWIFHAREAIYNCEEEFGLPKRDGLVSQASNYGYLFAWACDSDEVSKWAGTPGFSYARWKFWKERIEWVSELRAIRQETRDVARKVVEKMTEIEANEGM